MSNPFTAESRDSRLTVGLEGVLAQLRAPATLHALVMRAKPMTVPVGDFALKAMFDAHLIAAIMRSDYREVYDTLVSLFGNDVTSVSQRKPPAKAEVTAVTSPAKRQNVMGGPR